MRSRISFSLAVALPTTSALDLTRYLTEVTKCAQVSENDCSQCNQFLAGISVECRTECEQWSGLGSDFWLGDISVASLYGRFLLCLAVFWPTQRSDNTLQIVDVFAGSGGGSPLLFQTGLDRRCDMWESQPGGRMITFEKDPAFVEFALAVLSQNPNVPVATIPSFEWARVLKALHENNACPDSHADQLQCYADRNKTFSSSCYENRPDALLLDGDVYENPSKTLSLLQNIDILHWDASPSKKNALSSTDGVIEEEGLWRYFESFGQPWIIALHNINLHDHGSGWISERLQAVGWKVLKQSYHEDLPDVVLDAEEDEERPESVMQMFPHGVPPAISSQFVENESIRGWIILYRDFD